MVNVRLHFRRGCVVQPESSVSQHQYILTWYILRYSSKQVCPSARLGHLLALDYPEFETWWRSRMRQCGSSNYCATRLRSTDQRVRLQLQECRCTWLLITLFVSPASGTYRPSSKVYFKQIASHLLSLLPIIYTTITIEAGADVLFINPEPEEH